MSHACGTMSKAFLKLAQQQYIPIYGSALLDKDSEGQYVIQNWNPCHKSGDIFNFYRLFSHDFPIIAGSDGIVLLKISIAECSVISVDTLNSKFKFMNTSVVPSEQHFGALFSCYYVVPHSLFCIAIV